jgi:hypothetical protein
MRYINLVRTLICFFIFACSSFAIAGTTNRFEQGFKVINESSQAILVQDLSAWWPHQNEPLLPDSVSTDTFGSPKLVVTSSEQQFEYPIKIVSAKDNKLICLVTGHLTISETHIREAKPTSDAPACETGSYLTFDPENGLPIYGFMVTVH